MESESEEEGDVEYAVDEAEEERIRQEELEKLNEEKVAMLADQNLLKVRQALKTTEQACITTLSCLASLHQAEELICNTIG